GAREAGRPPARRADPPGHDLRALSLPAAAEGGRGAPRNPDRDGAPSARARERIVESPSGPLVAHGGPAAGRVASQRAGAPARARRRPGGTPGAGRAPDRLR